MFERHYTVKEIEEYLNVDEMTVRQWIQEDKYEVSLLGSVE